MLEGTSGDHQVQALAEVRSLRAGHIGAHSDGLKKSTEKETTCSSAPSLSHDKKFPHV